jgi:hypothetical protein
VQPSGEGRGQRLEGLPASACRAPCDELLALPADVEAHSRKEMGLAQEAFGRDGAGEG